MSIRHLRILIAVVDHKTMGAASKVLHISQPSISHAISELEQLYGFKLFDRIDKRLYLTENGKRMLSYARYIVSTYDAMNLDLKNAAENPVVRIGATIVFSTCFLPDIVWLMKEQSPAVSLNITTTNTKTVEDMILNSELDFGIVEGSISNSKIVRRHLLTDQLCLICGRRHRFYGKAVSFEEFEGESVITRENYSFLRNFFDRMAKEHDITYNEVWRCSGNEALLAAVRSGYGIAIASSILIADELKAGDLYAIPVKGISMTREFCLVYHKSKFIYPAMQKAIAACERHVMEVIARESASSRYILP